MNNEARLAAEVMTFTLRLKELGLAFAGVVRDPSLQSDHVTRLYYIGNLPTMEEGEELMARYVEVAMNPEHTVESYKHVKLDMGANPA